MGNLDAQLDYWNGSGTTKTFGHPLDLPWLDQLDPGADILDVGCGYGRLAGELSGAGFANVVGVDFAPALIDRARAENPGNRFEVQVDPRVLPFPDRSFDAALLFAVLTCIPGDDAQRVCIAEIHRVLRPGGLLYVSDLCLQDDARNLARYEQFAEQFGTYGVFETTDGAVCRHHRLSWLRDLLGDFEPLETRETPVATMNGNPALATQLLVARVN
jgi:SAM-dependent methyltransferase